MNANEARPHTDPEGLLKKAVPEETDREERRKRRIRYLLVLAPVGPLLEGPHLSQRPSTWVYNQRKENIVCVS